jgi:uncharacterized integral membrane protein (TIGR00698 family)
MTRAALVEPALEGGARRLLPGLALAGAIGLAATGVGRLVPVVGAPVIAIAAGMLAAPLAGRIGLPVTAVVAGGRIASRYVLQAAIVLFGTGLSLASVLHVGLASLPVMLGTLAACLGMAWLAGRLLGVGGDLRTLIAAGTGICGASAIGALAPVLAASEAAVGYAMSTIFVFNVAAVLIFPVAGHLLGLGAHGFGLWAGTAINDTSSVTAAGYAYGRAAGDYAIVVKLTRALMIIPMVLVAGARRAGGPGVRPRIHTLVPPFLPLFLLAVLANSTGLVPKGAHPALGFAAGLGVAVAMAGVGLGIRPGELRRAGPRPLVLGGILSVTVALVGLGLQALVGG